MYSKHDSSDLDQMTLIRILEFWSGMFANGKRKIHFFLNFKKTCFFAIDNFDISVVGKNELKQLKIIDITQLQQKNVGGISSNENRI